jgi:hypothetical protein
MFKFFKRAAAPAPKSVKKPAPQKKPPAQAAAVLGEPVPVPDVVEGNDHTDWALWEDSMNVLDSQMQSITPSARIYEKDKRIPSQFQELDGNDAFANVRKKRDV